MPEIEIYTSPLCGYCSRAKRLLVAKGVTYQEINVMLDPARRAEMIERAGGGRTVPQIFIDDQLVGGCDELHQLEHEGRLNTLLTGTA